MDPITGAIVAAVLWIVAGAAGSMVLIVGSTVAGGTIAKREDDGMFVGAFIGWALAVAWDIFAAIMAIIQIVRIVQLLTGTA